MQGPSSSELIACLDPMDGVQIVDGSLIRFRDAPGKTLADYLRAVVPPQVQAKWSNEL